MARFNVSIDQIHTMVPASFELNIDSSFDPNEVEKIIAQTGIRKRHITSSDTTAADLCKGAALKILQTINANDIGVLVYITQYPDHLIPSTAHQLQYTLGLAQDTVVIQVNEGCSGYIYGLYLAASLLEKSMKQKALLLVGDTTSKVIDPQDQSTKLIFGDAGSATLLSKSESEIIIELGSDGGSWKDIHIDGGGFKNNQASPYLHMNGINVFSFSISKVPKEIERFLLENNIEKTSVDYLVFHQANMMMNQRIVRKLAFAEDKALYSLSEYGNTSNASIPLTLTTTLPAVPKNGWKVLSSGFGVGMSWGVAHFSLDQDIIMSNSVT